MADELRELRRDFHRHPELGFREYRTSRKVREYLDALGLETEQLGETGVLALLRGGAATESSPAVLLRADMDALPITEETGLPYASREEGLMHACGHDGHMAMLLGAAKLLSEMGNQLPGTVKFLFQPNEEEAGAWKMIEAGALQNPRPAAAFALHLWSQCPAGTVDIVDGPQMAASYYFHITIRGSGGHAGFVHQAVDPLYTAAVFMQAVQAVQTREIDALKPAVIMCTALQAGSNTTIVPDRAEIKGSLRFIYEGGEELFERFERVLQHTCAAHRTEYELRWQKGNGLLSNSPEIAEHVRAAAAETLGDASRVTAGIRTMAGEDFSDYLQELPGAFAFLGIHNPAAGAAYPHHHPRFTIDEEVLPLGAELHVRTALRLLERLG
jgi:amidohydrolase